MEPTDQTKNGEKTLLALSWEYHEKCSRFETRLEWNGIELRFKIRAHFELIAFFTDYEILFDTVRVTYNANFHRGSTGRNLPELVHGDRKLVIKAEPKSLRVFEQPLTPADIASMERGIPFDAGKVMGDQEGVSNASYFPPLQPAGTEPGNFTCTRVFNRSVPTGCGNHGSG